MTSSAHNQALAQMQSIAKMVAALGCDYDRMGDLRNERDGYAAGPATWAAENPAAASALATLEDSAGGCTDADDAQNKITEDPLSVEVRGGWVTLGEPLEAEAEAEEFRIILCTGGPHVELVGNLNRGTPHNVRCVYRDWGEGDELFDFDHVAALTYCQQFYFGG